MGLALKSSKMSGLSSGNECCEREESPRGRDLAMGCVNPTPVENNPKIRSINIEQLDLGYVVRVGCQSFAIETSSKLISALGEYLNAPNETEKKWFSGTFLK
jgi:hypothetical protein